jgi:hypothetical protein
MPSTQDRYRRALLTAKRSNHIADSITPVHDSRTLPFQATLPHIKKVLILLHKDHLDVLPTLNPTQKVVLASYHNLLISLYAYIKSKTPSVNGGSHQSWTYLKRTPDSTNSVETISTSRHPTECTFTQIANSLLRSLQRTHLPVKISPSGLRTRPICHWSTIRKSDSRSPPIVHDRSIRIRL